MKYLHIGILLTSSLILYCLNFSSSNFIAAIFFGFLSCMMAMSSHLFINGVKINKKIESISLLNLISKTIARDDILTKQNDRSLFFLIFVFYFVLFSLVTGILSPSEFDKNTILFCSFLFSLSLSFFIARRETDKVDR